MQLHEFIARLFAEGSVTVARQVAEFTEMDIRDATLELEARYFLDRQEMPGKAPGFDPEAAVWGAIFLYRTVQLLLLRDLDETAVTQYLQPYPVPVKPEIIYSVDLTFRYLPQVLAFAKGLAPDDPLVQQLKKTAAGWPFSSVGMEINQEADLKTILDHPSLKRELTDRIIKTRDIRRLSNPAVKGLVLGALGSHIGKFWPELHLQTTLATYGNEQ